MGAGASVLKFEGGGIGVDDATLNIDNWSGTHTSGGGTDQVIFGQSLSDAFLAKVYWVDQGLWGATQLASGEIVPVPEPAVIFSGLLLVGALGYDLKRRKSRKG
jgi:hypothetical protein